MRVIESLLYGFYFFRHALIISRTALVAAKMEGYILLPGDYYFAGENVEVMAKINIR